MEYDNSVKPVSVKSTKRNLVQLNNSQLVHESCNFITSSSEDQSVPNRNKYKLLIKCSLFFPFYFS